MNERVSEWKANVSQLTLTFSPEDQAGVMLGIGGQEETAMSQWVTLDDAQAGNPVKQMETYIPPEMANPRAESMGVV